MLTNQFFLYHTGFFKKKENRTTKNETLDHGHLSLVWYRHLASLATSNAAYTACGLADIPSVFLCFSSLYLLMTLELKQRSFPSDSQTLSISPHIMKVSFIPVLPHLIVCLFTVPLLKLFTLFFITDLLT